MMIEKTLDQYHQKSIHGEHQKNIRNTHTYVGDARYIYIHICACKVMHIPGVGICA